jgi:hypothetical protein
VWAAVQALRSPVVAAVWTMIDRLDARNFRRLQLAAEAGRTLGVLIRNASARGQPSWAEVRLGVGVRPGDRETRRQGEKKVSQRISLSPPLPVSLSSCRLLQVSLFHLRGGRSGGSALLEIDEATHEVREVEWAVGRRLSAVSKNSNVWPIADSQEPIAHHAPHPLPVVAELADPTDHSRPARA